MSTGKILQSLPDEEATELFAQDIAACVKPGDIIALSGDLGAGKTSLARAMIRALSNDPQLEVPSPTFTIVQHYDARIPIAHFDLYRIAVPEELDELGLEENSRGLTLVEWPERAGGQLNSDGTLWIKLEYSGDGRTAEISGARSIISRLQRSLVIREFLNVAGHENARRAHLTGDASARAYETVSSGSGNFILMNAPRQPDGPPVHGGKPYSQIAHLAEHVGPFIAIDSILRSNGFTGPEIYAADRDEGLLLIENLGREPFLDPDGKPVAERYLAAAELLASMHGKDWPRRIKVDDDYTHIVPDYDRDAQMIEVELLTDWYMQMATGSEASAEQLSEFRRGWNEVLDQMHDSERSLVLRDFHSPNIIWRGDRKGNDRLGIIDFQDAVIGPAAYDLASLAQDARVTISAALEREIVESYCDARASDRSFDRRKLERDYAIMTIQRNTKILGIFVRLDRRDGKPAYMAHLPRIKEYIGRSIRHGALAPLRDFYAKIGIGVE